MDTRTLIIFLISTGFSVLSDLTLSFCPRPFRQLLQIYMFPNSWGTDLGKVHYYIYNSLPQVPNLHHINPDHIFPLFFFFISLKYILVSYFCTHIFQSVSSLQLFQTKFHIQLSCLLCVLPALPMSSFLISSSQKYL